MMTGELWEACNLRVTKESVRRINFRQCCRVGSATLDMCVEPARPVKQDSWCGRSCRRRRGTQYVVLVVAVIGWFLLLISCTHTHTHFASPSLPDVMCAVVAVVEAVAGRSAVNTAHSTAGISLPTHSAVRPVSGWW